MIENSSHTAETNVPNNDLDSSFHANKLNCPLVIYLDAHSFADPAAMQINLDKHALLRLNSRCRSIFGITTNHNPPQMQYRTVDDV